MTPNVPAPLAEQRAHLRRLCRLARADEIADLLESVPPAKAARLLIRLQTQYPGPDPIPVPRAEACS